MNAHPANKGQMRESVPETIPGAISGQASGLTMVESGMPLSDAVVEKTAVRGKAIPRPGFGVDFRVGKRRPILWLTGLVLGLFVLWAANAPLEEVTRGNGKVIPISRGQIIQSLEGGILKSIDVQEGDEVSAGQTLAIIDDTGFRAEYTDLKGQTIALRASLSRLYAELNGDKTIAFEPEVEKAQDVITVERDLFRARQRKLRETVSSITDKLVLAQRHLELVSPMVKAGATSKVEGIKVEREVSDLKGQLDEAKNTYYQEVNDLIAKQSAELASLNQKLAQKQDALTRTELKSPVRGIVKNLSLTTRGGVVKPGETIMEIVPLDDQLYVEAEIKPRDVAFLSPGLPATVKITAYDYSIYGSLKGKLVFISADTMSADTIRAEMKRDNEPYYRVRVLTDTAYLHGPDGPLPIKPGMVAEVDIQTGAKTVLDYLLKPILKFREAMSER
ncbi:MAG: HlyD family type I secretion periplasmic adaptor subunit [Brucella intermedia]